MSTKLVLNPKKASMRYNGLRSVHPNARIGNDVTIDNFVTIAEDVEIGDGTWIGPQVTIMDGVRIGKNCKIFPGAVIGAIPQDLKFKGEKSIVEIGNNVTIREYCTINRGTMDKHQTVINDNCLLMAYVHIAHDCIIGKNAILANNVNLAGHIEIGEYAILGGMVPVHQFVKIGKHCMIGGGSLVRKDVPPFIKAAREPLCFSGINSIGLSRRGFTKERINHIKDAYRILYVNNNNVSQAIEKIENELEANTDRDEILTFVKQSRDNRGLIRGFRQLNGKH